MNHEADRSGAFHTMNPTGRFSDRVEDYKKFRPTYPGEAIAAILRGLGVPRMRGRVAADVGAGTGISSRLLAERGVRVIAVEPNEAMRRGGEAEGGGVEWRAGTAEATGLEEASVDVVLCAQAFHWFEPAAALREFHRILRRGGRLAIMWNCRDRDDAFTAGYGRAIAEIGGESKLETKEFDASAVDTTGLFSPLKLQVFPNEQALDEGGLMGRALSASYVPKEGPGRARLERSLRVLYAQFADERGLVRLKYRTEVYLAERS